VTYFKAEALVAKNKVEAAKIDEATPNSSNKSSVFDLGAKTPVIAFVKPAVTFSLKKGLTLQLYFSQLKQTITLSRSYLFKSPHSFEGQTVKLHEIFRS
jgi:hypothetical protein